MYNILTIGIKRFLTKIFATLWGSS